MASKKHVTCQTHPYDGAVSAHMQDHRVVDVIKVLVPKSWWFGWWLG